MAPNSEEEPRSGWRAEILPKESQQRPPIYNPEDYAFSLKKWGRKTCGLQQQQLPLYATQSTGSLDTVSSTNTNIPNNNNKLTRNRKESKDNNSLVIIKDNKENIFSSTNESEMSLRQFSSVSELLTKLKMDLQSAFPSFVQEFVGDPVDGVTLLLELLRAVQLSQASQQQRCPPQVLRRALLDEHACLLCLQHCLRCGDASRRLAASPAGLFTLAVCIMSNVTKSRVLALELLTKACEPPANGHTAVSDALSTLRLRFGEPVRFRFLVGMLHSAGSADLLSSGMKFINAYLSTAPNLQQRVYIQAELEQAGFNADILKKTLPTNADYVRAELLRWERSYVDVQNLQSQAAETVALREKIHLLEKRIKILQEEKGILRSLEQCLKERCSELEEEVSIRTTTTSLTKSTAHVKPFSRYEKGSESTPAEDEGISSSEQELSQDDDEVILKRQKESADDATIEEVIEELRTIAETQKIPESKAANDDLNSDRTKTFTKDVKEIEIVPSVILPKPPRRTRSLVHIFLPDGEDGKHEFFEDDDETDSSDSLLTETRFDMPSTTSLFQIPPSETFQERNIDEEAKKRRPEKSPFVRRTQRFVPVPVKRSQTFHSQEPATRSTPKMGVSGLQDVNKRHHQDRYSKSKAAGQDRQRRGSLDDLTFTLKMDGQRCRSLERVNTDIVIEPTPENSNVMDAKFHYNRNIGPRNRRSLAESSLFTAMNKPQPATRSSISRTNSASSAPLHLPVEITIGHQPSTNQRHHPLSFFRSNKDDTRYPPDGSSSPMSYEPPQPWKNNRNNEEAIYATPMKLSKLQKFFGNPKFDNSSGNNESNDKYFESHYAAPQNQPRNNVMRTMLQPQNSFYLGQAPIGRKPGTGNSSVYSLTNQSSSRSSVVNANGKIADSLSGLY